MQAHELLGEGSGVSHLVVSVGGNDALSASGVLYRPARSAAQARAELMQHTAAAERFDEIARQLDHNLERLNSRVEGLDKEGVRAAETYTASQKQAEDLNANLRSEEQKLVGLNVEKEQLLAATASAREVQRSAESALGTLQDEHSAKKHRLATLLELEEKRAVYTPQVQKLFAEEQNIGVKLSGVLADRLNVAEEAETAVEMLRWLLVLPKSSPIFAKGHAARPYFFRSAPASLGRGSRARPATHVPQEGASSASWR